ncbi:MAG: propionyl-coenzyme A carboxylase alpha polypeptide [Mesorhizobium sp.]|nr:MAG: propionyl-coenzyme A carboxylase alpha polypeptide [Mesorhizobium sp.]RWQ39193.1 MAG: propionyl-coenzyme A carboxylase alpha polypeptide [Mesorhizobium sp.]
MPDISPTRGEIGCHLHLRQSPTSHGRRRSSELPISPQAGEMSGRTEGGAVEHSVLM